MHGLLGILPGAGGTQRLPRLIGVKNSLDMILSGRHVASTSALSLGIIDHIVKTPSASASASATTTTSTTPSFLLEEAIDYASKVAKLGSASLAERRVSLKTPADKEKFSSPVVWDETLKLVKTQYRGYDAPLGIVNAVQASLALPFAQGMEKEKELVYKLFNGPQAAALQHLFFAEREVGRIPGLDESLAKKIRSVGIIGSGTMGGGIAMVFLNANIPVVLLDTKQEFLDKGVEIIRRNYGSDIKKGTLTEEKLAARLKLLKPSLQYSDLKDVDLVIEAVFENMKIKKQVFAELDRVCKPDAILASNTSTLDIDEVRL